MVIKIINDTDLDITMIFTIILSLTTVLNVILNLGFLL